MSNLGPVPVSRQLPNRISPREAEVLDLAGLRCADIAVALDISTHTVKSHLRSAFLKLNVETRAAAVEAWRDRRAA
jgi:DNA-binding CsgD family transcriptional regulator